MCKFKLFTIAAAALMMAACSSEDITQQPKTGEMQFTATIAAPSNGGTRTAYTVDGTDIKVAWKVGDEIALVHNGVKDVATVKSVDATTGQATISGIITGTPADGDAVKLIYPAAYISGVNSDGFPTMDEGYYNLLFAQDGTLDYIQNNIDFRHNDNGQLSVTETGVTLKSTVIMESSMAIWKLTLQDDAATPAALAATKVTIMSGSDELASTAVLTTGKSTLYLAVPADGTSANICITAATADNDYFYMKEGVALATGKYYQSTVQMTKGAHLAFLSADYEAKDGAILTGTLDGAHKISIADGATVTLDGVTINGVHSDWYLYAGITCLGDATIILKEGTTNTVNGFDGAFPGIQGAAGKTLTIQGTGTLIAASDGTGAGIGSAAYSDNYPERACGAIVIEGGTITATGGNRGAGIGSGGSGRCGTITISGGTVTATGGQYAAGIGSGDSGSCGNITISGGTVSATGGNSAAGIGSGYDGICGNITITTGVTQVTATRDGGFETVGSGGNGTCGTVTIGGVVGAISTSPYIYPTPPPSTAINGKFTINASGKQVYFAKGNLQATTTDNGANWSWGFAENQWDFVGNAAANNAINGNGTVSTNGTVDLFGWSTAATTYGIHNSTDAGDYSGAFVDWGGTIGPGWRTLSKDEWNYLFSTRASGSKVNDLATTNARYTHATINTDDVNGGIKGMILFPDGVTINYNDVSSWGGINQYSSWNGSTKCTTSQWNALAAKGFVFLPTAGSRNGTTINYSNDNGYYWSSYTASPTNNNAHYTPVVASNEPTTGYDSRKCGFAVRLVYPIE